MWKLINKQTFNKPETPQDRDNRLTNEVRDKLGNTWFLKLDFSSDGKIIGAKAYPFKLANTEMIEVYVKNPST